MREFSNTPYVLTKMNLGPVLYIVRHGETGDDDSYNSPENPYLNERGKEQAKEVANFFVGKKVGDLISSKMHRAEETGRIIGKKLGITPFVKTDLDSLDVGDVTNMASEDEADRVIKHHRENPDKKIPGGESLNDFSKRIRPEFIDNIKKFYQTGRPSILSVHHSVQHEAGQFFNGDRDSALTKPGGVVAVFKTPSGYQATAVFKPDIRK